MGHTESPDFERMSEARAISRESKLDRDEAAECLASAMMQCSLATGHGETIKELCAELIWQVRELQTRLASAGTAQEKASE